MSARASIGNKLCPIFLAQLPFLFWSGRQPASTVMARLCCRWGYTVGVLLHMPTAVVGWRRCAQHFSLNQQGTVFMPCADDPHIGGGDEVCLGCGARSEYLS